MQAPFTVAGVQRCGEGPGERAPWWVPLAVTTSHAPDQRVWHAVEECQPTASIASLAVRSRRCMGECCAGLAVWGVFTVERPTCLVPLHTAQHYWHMR